ncbi:peroxide stress protein YaaA [uncultured Umboniibacter sp.]|uniref:peroxide stress protein YaaA n=1 Tax=uncultured Umboniibacter sp. TaxID=1798917 RepID=UPI00261F95F3|nr:peroxide stress protein YaaA [uncultured Umboniibacter sp.]
MLILISPAKTLDFDQDTSQFPHSETRFDKRSEQLVSGLRLLSAEHIAKLMSVSEAISKLNFERFQNWQPPALDASAKQAIFAFRGDVYTGLDADSLSSPGLDVAQTKLRILSGLYGLLRPLDNILPYRLEMGTKFTFDEYNNLYQFWGSDITEQLNRDLLETKNDVVVNLASNEYFKAVKPKLVNATIVTPVFKDTKNGKEKVISFYAKKARGRMARWLIDNPGFSLSDLRSYDLDGYVYSPDQSSTAVPTFVRAEL